MGIGVVLIEMKWMGLWVVLVDKSGVGFFISTVVVV